MLYCQKHTTACTIYRQPTGSPVCFWPRFNQVNLDHTDEKVIQLLYVLSPWSNGRLLNRTSFGVNSPFFFKKKKSYLGIFLHFKVQQ